MQNSENGGSIPPWETFLFSLGSSIGRALDCNGSFISPQGVPSSNLGRETSYVTLVQWQNNSFYLYLLQWGNGNLFVCGTEAGGSIPPCDIYPSGFSDLSLKVK